ncbi:MAG TPA: hypothetical protein VK971_10335 [Thiohalobacter sp.]|nr:hypothetical protein [Thiohalobacter sp.]
MPHFDIDEAMRYAGDKHSADAVLDLSDMEAEEAIRTLDEVFAEPSEYFRSLIVRFTPAGPQTGETLFQPVGRYLLEKKKAGEISRLENLLELGAGFYIEF